MKNVLRHIHRKVGPRLRVITFVGVLACFVPAITFLAVSRLFPFPMDELESARQRKECVCVLDRNGRILRVFNSDADVRSIWVPLSRMSPWLIQATISVEDERFSWHPGVDPVAVCRAVISNLRRGRVVSGASTLTMQLVRLTWNRPRTFKSKAIESFRALQLERFFSKRQILEWYLNLAPYGGNIVGVGAAARRYFNKPSNELTLAEAALIAGLPKSPSRLRPDRYPERAIRRREHVLHRMLDLGYISRTEFTNASQEPVFARRYSFPFSAPHLAQLVREKFPGKRRIRTTLDPAIQQLAERVLKEHVRRLRPAHVSNGAVVVIENKSGALRGLVGSVDFFSNEDQGQVNGATAPRSPGSALKPFTYALAFENGVCVPGTVLPDVPLNYSGYEPKNYDRKYRGVVTASGALTASLNAPAVWLLRKVGFRELHRFLRRLGITTLRGPASRYGLALTLGSAAVNLLELTNAYATLARGGMYIPYRLSEDQSVPRPLRIISPGTAYVVSEVLGDPGRIQFKELRSWVHKDSRFAWKTGTSYGNRDAWCVAYTPRFTVGVWMGNFTGRPSKALVGIRAAAPVAASILIALQDQDPDSWFECPASVSSVSLCSASGALPGPFCTTLSNSLFIRGHSPTARCTVHALVKVTRDRKARLCDTCCKNTAFETVVMETWPTLLAAWFKVYEPGRAVAPPHLTQCPRAAASSRPPIILSPPDGQRYIMNRGLVQETQKLLLKAVSNRSVLYWFVDGELYAAAGPAEPVFWPLYKGTHRLVCADQTGRSSHVTIRVE